MVYYACMSGKEQCVESKPNKRKSAIEIEKRKSEENSTIQICWSGTGEKGQLLGVRTPLLQSLGLAFKTHIGCFTATRKPSSVGT